MDLVTLADIREAQARLSGVANSTPVQSSRYLNTRFGAELFFKCENFQRVGAFKFRGAYNAISQLSAAQKNAGVLAFSSGNHAQGIALASQLLGVKATIVMPENAPEIKLAATRGYAAEVITFNPIETSREAVAADLLKKHKFSLIPPFDHPHIIAGQGTAAAELIDEIKQLDVLMTPCGGGGLLSGSAVAAKSLLPNIQVLGVEPELGDDATRSFKSGKIETVKNPQTIADGTRTESISELTFAHINAYVNDMITVSEDDIKAAVRLIFSRLKLVVEPSAALPLAAIMAGKIKAKGRIGIILSGGNIDAQTMADILKD
jgi:threonine dehydratase